MVLGLVAVLFVGQARAEDTFILWPLIDMSGVHVTVNVSNGYANIGLTAEALRTLAELTFRRRGIRVLTEKEMYSAEGMPQAHISVNLLSASDGMVVYTTRLSLRQNVTGSNGRAIATAETWTDAGSLGIAHRLELLGVIRSSVEQMAEKLSNDYLKANPPKPVVEKELLGEANEAASKKKPASPPKSSGVR
ncbi:hypothetical protein D7X74_35745 [Corallococcus sp. CA047B]|nr:hypothetical protein D7X74_35745 [Corallococcus sp. CA047B]